MPLSLKDQYQSVISRRDYKYFDAYAPDEQDRIIQEAIHALHKENVARMKSCVAPDNQTQLLGLISHELRTPLNGVVAILDLMQSDAVTPDQSLYRKSLEQSCMYLHLVVNRLQDIAARASNAPSWPASEF
jgi:signal transduction histidine kinase